MVSQNREVERVQKSMLDELVTMHLLKVYMRITTWCGARKKIPKCRLGVLITVFVFERICNTSIDQSLLYSG